MPKKFLKRFMPHPDKVRKHKHLQIFGKLLHDPNLLHLNRRSVSGAFAVGFFIMWMPVPFQMLLAAVFAIIFRVNIVISVPLVWISNPVTVPPMFYFAYLVGTWMLGTPAEKFTFRLEKAGEILASYGTPLILGCLVMASLSALVGYVGMRLLWRWHVISQLAEKKKRQKLKKAKK